ncbi:MAG: hypothetical protein DRI90_27385 [Deltaproteobacteria bacterium]|nr:MAG: hypothetical protein DRI90_27385 [Deltaproteobacteria bacterium]
MASKASIQPCHFFSARALPAASSSWGAAGRLMSASVGGSTGLGGSTFGSAVGLAVGAAVGLAVGSGAASTGGGGGDEQPTTAMANAA